MMLRNARIITRLQWTLRVVALVACVLAPFAAGASAAEEAKPANAGITTGQVTEITDEFVLIRPTDDTPHRHWFRSSASATTRPAGGVRTGATKVKAGDWVEARWSFDDRRRLESIKVLPAPPIAAAKQGVKKAEAPKPGRANGADVAPAAPAPGARPTHVGPAGPEPKTAAPP